MTLRESVDMAVYQTNTPYKVILEKKISVFVQYASKDTDSDDDDTLIYRTDREYTFQGTYAEWLFHISTTMYGWIGEVTPTSTPCNYTQSASFVWSVVRYE